MFDDWGNRAKGRLVEGKKNGPPWTVTLARGGVIMESHVDGVFHGPWTFDLPKGRFCALNFEDGRLHGPWEHRHGDHYNEAGAYETGERQGAWTLAWADGVEALVPYVDGVIHGEMTVTRDGGPLGTLLYWKGQRVDGVLNPFLIGEPLDP